MLSQNTLERSLWLMSKSSYKDKDKYRANKRKCHKKYYKKTANSINSNKRYTEEEIIMILRHELTDPEISKKIGRSVNSIQVMRIRYKDNPYYKKYVN